MLVFAIQFMQEPIQVKIKLRWKGQGLDFLTEILITVVRGACIHHAAFNVGTIQSFMDYSLHLNNILNIF